MNCINTNSKEFKELLEASKLPSVLLEMRISKFQDDMGLDNYPKLEDIINEEVDFISEEIIQNDVTQKAEYVESEANHSNKNESVIEKFFSKLIDNNSTFQKVRSEDTMDVTERKIEILQESLNAVVIVDTSIPDSGQLLPSNHPLTIKNEKPVIVINPNKLFSDTVTHEFGHLYIDLLGEEDSFVKQAHAMLAGTSMAKEISENYPELNPVDLRKEILATALGMEGDKIFKQSLQELSTWQKIKNAILEAISKMFNIQPNAVEVLARELMENKVRLNGTEKFNSTIIQRSRFKIDTSSKTKQQDILNLYDSLTKEFTKESIDGNNVYVNKKGEKFLNSVTKDIKQYKTFKIKKDKGDFDTKFDRALYNADNINMVLDAPKIPMALARALNDLMNNKIVDTNFIPNEKDYVWADAYVRSFRKEDNDPNDLTDEVDNLTKNFLNEVKEKVTFDKIINENLDLLLDRAEEYQAKSEQAPAAGNIIHDAIEDYVKELISGNKNAVFPKNIDDEDGMLLKVIKDIILTGLENGSQFRTEQIIFSENRQTPGTMDLVEVKANGDNVIYDYKTINSFQGYNSRTKSKYNRSDQELFFMRGYAHQLLSYGAILNQYNITLADDAYRIVMAEIQYQDISDSNSNVKITGIKNKSLSDRESIKLLDSNRVKIFKKYASSKQLEDIKIKPDVATLADLSRKIHDTVKGYQKITKNISSNFDDSFINKIKEDLNKEKLSKDLDEYRAKSNEVIIKSYVTNVHEALANLEAQKDVLGELVSSDYLQSLNYVLQSTKVLDDIKRILSDESSEEDEISVTDKKRLLEVVNNTIEVVDDNRAYYIDKTKRSAIASFVENSNLMIGFYAEKYQVEANGLGLKEEAKDEYIKNKLIENKDLIKISEIEYWTKQYQDGITDLRFMEYLIADPGMSKSQFVQLTKNILDKTDMSVRNTMLDIVPEINDWYEKLSFAKTGNPREVWNKFIEKDSEGNLKGAVIPEFTSKLRELYLRYDYQMSAERKVFKKAKTQEQRDISSAKMEAIAEKRRAEMKLKYDTDSSFEVQYIHPEFAKLSEAEKEDARYIHKNLIEADDRLYSSPEKKLTKQMNDGTYIYNLPRERQSRIEAIKTGDNIKNFKSKIEDLRRPPADEDEMNVEEYDSQKESFGNNNLDLEGNELFTIPIYYRNELEDDSMQSYDIPTLLVNNHETTVFYSEHKLVEADLFNIAESLSSKNNNKILKTDSFINKKIQDKVGSTFQKSDENLVYQAVKSSIDNRLYKRNYRGVYSKGNYRLIKGLEMLSSYSSLISLSGNFMSALTTAGQGSVYRLMEGYIGEHFTMEDWKKASKKTIGDYGAMIQDTQNFAAKSRTNLFIKKFGLETQANALVNKFVQDNFAYKQLDKGMMFAVTSIAENIVTANLMYSLLGNIKAANENGEYINKEGKVVSKKEAMSLDEAYEVVDGKLVLNEFVKYTSQNITVKYADGLNKDSTLGATGVSRYIRGVYADMYGQYNQDMKSVMQRNVFGKLAMSLRGWLPRGVHRRWRGITDVIGSDYMSFTDLRDEKNIDKRFYSQDQRKFQEGHYSTTIRFVRSLYSELTSNMTKLSLNEAKMARGRIKALMTDHEIANLKRTNYEIGVFLVLTAISIFLRNLAKSQPDDEDKEKIYFASYLAFRISNEVSTFFNPWAMADMIANPAASLTMTQRLFDWMNQLIGISFEEDGLNFNVNDIYQAGAKKDKSKALIKTLGLIPGYTKSEQLKSVIGIQSENSLSDSFEFQRQ